MSDPQAVAAAYDAIAGDYDRLVAEDDWMRRVLWSHYDAVFAPGDRVLELGCGTGLDTLHLAERGLEVVAVDVSQRMIERLRARLDGHPHHRRVGTVVGDAAELDFPGRPFDGLVSAFATANTCGDLPHFAAAVARLVRPGGRMILHLLAPAGVWERGQAWRREGLAAARALAERRRRTVEIGGRTVHHRVAPAAEAIRGLAPTFRLCRAYGLGFLWPRSAGRRLPPRWARFLGRAEAHLGSLPTFRGWGRFYVLDLERRR